tara:strand:- start:3783 stop:4757 length:975 start_codon:yes stop_codon:yes gene_type:complete
LNILVTGAAGFIGSRLCLKLLENKNNFIYGVDNLNNYYSPKFKRLRLKELTKKKNFRFLKIDLKNKKNFKRIESIKKIDLIYHLAAQAGVRFTLKSPKKYFEDNIVAFFNLINLAKQKKIRKFFYASSSSIYGDQLRFPIKENSKLNTKNFYGFSKYINEITSKTFSDIYDIKVVGLRFFTVFGEWGRPDMLIFKYLKSNLENKKFYLNENGEHYRDFTYIDDVIKILTNLKKIRLKKNYQILNICSNNPIKIINIIKYINKNFPNFKYTPIFSETSKKVEVVRTHGDNRLIKNILKKTKFTDFKSSLDKTIKWYITNEINKIT